MDSSPFRVPLLVSIAFHVFVLFGIGFGFLNQPSTPENEQLLITLVNAASEDAPDDAKILAQANMDGGGTLDDERVATTITPGQTLPVVSELGVQQLPVASSSTDQHDPVDRVLTAYGKTTIFSTSELEEERELVDERNREHQDFSQEISRLSATLDKKIQRYSQQPRHTFLSSRARQYEYAAYMKKWVERVERVGNRLIPKSGLLASLSGELVLDVAVNRKGEVVSRSVTKSSGNPSLDGLARQIVAMAAPFPKLSADIVKKTDVLHIVRTWQFSADGSWQDITNQTL